MTPWNAEEPYNDLAPLSEDVPLDLSKLSPMLIEARVQLARLDEVSKTLTNPMILVNAIAVVEAQASSAIENIVTTNDKLFQNRAVGADPIDSETLTAMRNRSALQTAYQRVQRAPISAALAKQVCSELLGFEVGYRKGSGTYIGSPSRRVYTPPDGERLIANMLDDWQSFVNQSQRLDPLIVLALSHYQFEAIHPFSDGNGRTGRILNVAFLVEKGLLEMPVIHLSRAISARRDEYYERLLAVTAQQKWQEWVQFFLEVLAWSAIQSIQQVKELTTFQKSLVQSFRGNTFKHGLPDQLVRVLFERPYCLIGHVVDACQVSRPTAAKWLEELEKLEVLKSVRIGREKYFINHKMLEVLS